MTVPSDQRAWLEREHGFADWRAADRSTAQAVRDFAFRGDELPGWTLVKSTRNDAFDPPRLDTFWQPTGTADALLGVRIIERPSGEAAREALLGVLADVQSAAIRRRTDLGIGEVAFGQEMMVAFVRGNLVVIVRNAGRRVFEVLDVARQVDAVVAKAQGPR